MYHDVAPRGREHASGFPGGDAARYKLALDRFDAHLAAIARRVPGAVVTFRDVAIDRSAKTLAEERSAKALAERRGARPSPVLLTFDDGGVSAAGWVADALERRGWRGHFFITTSRLGEPGFVDTRQLRDLRARGHILGSHSHSHPLRMAHCTEDRLRDEWTRSCGILSDALGEPIAAASEPGGDYSSTVARTASDAGIRFLFTSEPTMRVWRVGGMLVFGRFAIQRSTAPGTAAGLAAGDAAARLRWLASWQARRAC
jgi:hypothetical protein